MSAQFIVRPVYNEKSRIVGYEAEPLLASGHRDKSIEKRPAQASSVASVLEAEAAGWVYFDDGWTMGVMDDHGNGGVFSMRDLALR